MSILRSVPINLTTQIFRCLVLQALLRDHKNMETDCSTAKDDLPLRQGDIFVWKDRAWQRPWSTFGIIITADCDLEQRKTRGQLSYLPALMLEDYVWTFWRIEKFSPIQERLRKKAVDRLNKVLVRLKPNQRPISETASLDWISRTEPGGLAKEVGLTDLGQIKDFCAIIDNYKQVERLLATSNPDVDLLNRCHAISRGVSLSSDFSELSREVQSKIASLPGDVFFISGVEGYERFGLFVMLRHITQCSIDCVAIKPEELRWGSASAQRIARVNAPYKFALAQNMARVFLDIGLPSSYAARQNNSPVAYFESCGGERESSV